MPVVLSPSCTRPCDGWLRPTPSARAWVSPLPRSVSNELSAVAIVCPPGINDVVTLLNPRVIEASEHTDEQYESCLSFFDVRCLVPRPLILHVEHQDTSGDRRITIFEHGIARLVAHEIDHLQGVLCRDHLPAGTQPIPVEQYTGTGATWDYSEPRSRR